MLIKNTVVSLKPPKKYDFILHLACIILVVFGALMILSSNIGNAGTDPLVLIKVAIKQLIFIVASYILLTFFANNFTMKRAKDLLPGIGFVMFILLASTQFFPESYGSRAWIKLSFAGQAISIQPAEFAKVFMIVVMAVYIEFKGRNKCEFRTIMKGPILYFLLCLIPIVLQRDIGTLLVFVAIPCFCFLIPSNEGIRKQQKFMKITMVVGVLTAFVLMSDAGINFFRKYPSLEHISDRISNAADPFNDPYGKGYQQINGLYGIASGGIKGKGIGNGTQKYGYLTQSDNDYILAIVIEELGLFGFSVILLMYMIIIQRLFYYALHTKSEGYKIILFGTACYIFIHFILNVGGVGGLIPLTGVPLLFISSGGSSLMSIMSAIGISQAVISRIRKQGTVAKKKKEPQGVRGS